MIICKIFKSIYQSFHYFNCMRSGGILVTKTAATGKLHPPTPTAWLHHPMECTLTKLYFQFLSQRMGYDHRDHFPFETNRIPFGSKSKGKIIQPDFITQWNACNEPYTQHKYRQIVIFFFWKLLTTYDLRPSWGIQLRCRQTLSYIMGRIWLPLKPLLHHGNIKYEDHSF